MMHGTVDVGVYFWPKILFHLFITEKIYELKKNLVGIYAFL